MRRSLVTLALAGAACLLPALALAGSDADHESHGRAGSDGRGAAAQLGPRPFFLVNDLTIAHAGHADST